MRTYGRVKIKLHHSWPRHWMKVSGQIHAPAVLTPGKEPPVPIGESEWTPEPVWTLWRRRECCTAGNRTWAFQSIARRYTDWAIPTQYCDLLRAGRPSDRSSSPRRVKDFLLSMSFRPVLGPPSLLSNGYRGALFLGLKRSGREAYHSPPTSARVKITWIYISIRPYVFLA
jgi:hypothetical protein